MIVRRDLFIFVAFVVIRFISFELYVSLRTFELYVLRVPYPSEEMKILIFCLHHDFDD